MENTQRVIHIIHRVTHRLGKNQDFRGGKLWMLWKNPVDNMESLSPGQKGYEGKYDGNCVFSEKVAHLKKRER